MQQLRRTKIGAFTINKNTTLYDLKDAYHFWKEKGKETELRKHLLPLEAALVHLPRIFVSDSCVDALCHGAQLALPGIAKFDSGIIADELVAVYTLKGEGVLLARALMTSEEMTQKKKGLSVKTERVLMKEGIYPKNERN
jgi:H/ACA ribonucleoprotein complex subunit 4